MPSIQLASGPLLLQSSPSPKLYISTVYCGVYRLYQGGNPIPKERLAAFAPRRGNLLFESMGKSSGLRSIRRRAILFDRDGNATIPPLIDAVVVKIDGRGFRINGLEVVSDRRDRALFRQAWIVKQL